MSRRCPACGCRVEHIPGCPEEGWEDEAPVPEPDDPDPSPPDADPLTCPEPCFPVVRHHRA